MRQTVCETYNGMMHTYRSSRHLAKLPIHLKEFSYPVNEIVLYICCSLYLKQDFNDSLADGSFIVADLVLESLKFVL